MEVGNPKQNPVLGSFLRPETFGRVTHWPPWATEKAWIFPSLHFLGGGFGYVIFQPYTWGG